MKKRTRKVEYCVGVDLFGQSIYVTHFVEI